MKNDTILFGLFLALLLFPSWSFPQNFPTPQEGEERAPYVADEVLVKFQPSARQASTNYYLKRWGMETAHRFRTIGTQHMKLPQGMSVEKALALLGHDNTVIYAEPNYLIFVDQLPNDPHFSKLWGLHNLGQEINDTPGVVDADIDAPEAWDMVTGESPVVVAVLDSGVDYLHPDLLGNIWFNSLEEVGDASGDGFPGIRDVDDDGDGLIDEDSGGNEPGDAGYLNDLQDDDDENGYADDLQGWDFYNNDNMPLPNDPGGHGTHVAGTIAAQGDNNTGIAGVAWTAKIMSLRFLNALGSGDTARAILAMEYAGANGADVINCSWGGGAFSQALYDAIESSGAVVVCAAGNNGADNDLTPHYPSSYDNPNIIAVAATDAGDNPALFSNYGAQSVDISAPGVNIYSCAPGRKTVWLEDFEEAGLDDWVIGGKSSKWALTDAQSFSGLTCLTDSPAGDYDNTTNSWIRAPELDLTGQNNTFLEFRLKGSSEAGYDYLFVEVSADGSIWNARSVKVGGMGTVLRISGAIEDWTTAVVDLSDYDGSSIFVRFSFLSDGSDSDDGWYIDDVVITAASAAYDDTEYIFRSGTSMAAPHVSGVAALIKAQNPSWTSSQIKEAIEKSADTLPVLGGLSLTAGRLNARNALEFASGYLSNDLDEDHDVDGVDLAIFAGDGAGLFLEDFAVYFGYVDYVEESGLY